MADTAATFSVALTGGIASGKSAATEGFARRGIIIVDADIVAREIVAPDGSALTEIAAVFGHHFIAADGQLDRRAMREHVFADDAARSRLESILHPRIHAEIVARASGTISPYALLVIPLLLESGHYDWVDRVLVVDVPRELQVERLMRRDGITISLAESMLAAQVSREERLASADDVIDNSGTLADLEDQVQRLHEMYLFLAAEKNSIGANAPAADLPRE
ncbi:MAG: dephospho-CoA kinase [Dokdonella sp.]